MQTCLDTLRDERGQLQACKESLEARLYQDCIPSTRPLTSDSPDKKPRRRTGAKRSQKAEGKPGHMGHRQTFVASHQPESWACGISKFSLISPYSTHQVIELPLIAMAIAHYDRDTIKTYALYGQ